MRIARSPKRTRGRIFYADCREGAFMLSKQPNTRKQALQKAMLGVVVEALEQRRLLTTCFDPAGGIMQVFGDNSGTGNNIVLSYNSGAATVTVTDSVAGATNCANIDAGGITAIEVYGGATETATNTGADT